jgi:hypothetical protein
MRRKDAVFLPIRALLHGDGSGAVTAAILKPGAFGL